MSPVQHLREFIRERLTAAAEEIFTEVEKTIIRYEEENRLMENYRKSQIKQNPNELQRQYVSNKEGALAIQQLCNQRRRSCHDQGEVLLQWTEEDQREPENSSPIKKLREAGPPWIKEEQERPASPLIKEENDEPASKWATEEYKEPDLQLIEEQNESGPTWAEEEPKSSVVELKEEIDSSLPRHEQWLPEHLPSRQDQGDLLSIQEEKQLVQKQSITLMETFTLQNLDLSEREPTTEQLSFHISPRFETKDQEGSSSIVSESQSQIDTKKKSFECDICGRSFMNKSTMKRHYRTHTGERPFPCKTCEKSFSRLHNLKTHMRTHTGERPLQCKTCGKGFSWISSLKYHIKTHTGEKPFPCKICRKSFSQICNLNNHIRTHTGERPFCCEICGKSFSRLYTLNVHIKSHTSEKV
ncbi:PREDICTED: zinc finger protein 184-like [Cyprinodon variegatus]|uniref:Zinc finger protein 184-like n=1 Tax=Cyprinodon variegatus TaxID=28743 RepID=A0A3Q2D750_CYPVA|nr:PREDICTED: zinc finger protein 184-like [Cyprinodon variegatus]